ncbi:hypothetical protein ACJ41O_007595 [Fusarium nematophilum]
MILTDLSNEVLHEIFSFFCLHCSNEFKQPDGVGTQLQDELHRPEVRPEQNPDERSWYAQYRQGLFSLTLTCKRLHLIAQDILYHEFALGYGDSCLSTRSSLDGRLPAFIRTIILRRDLAARVRKLYIHGLMLKTLTKEDIVVSLAQGAAALGVDLVAAWRKRVAETSPRNQEGMGWLFFPDREMHSADDPFYPQFYGDYLLAMFTPRFNELFQVWIDNDDVMPTEVMALLSSEVVAMLIALLPNIDHLGFQAGGAHELYPRSVKDLGIAALPNIRTLHARSGASEWYSDGAFVANMATNLRVLDMHRPTTLEDIENEMPNLKTLRLTDAWLTRAQMRRLLSRCTGELQTFVYEASDSDAMHDQEDSDDEELTTRAHFTAVDIVKALKKHRRTLEHFHLDFRLQYSSREVANPEYRKDFTLCDFPSLRSVFLNRGILTGTAADPEDARAERVVVLHDEVMWRRLPPSLERLYLGWEGTGEDTTELQLILYGLALAKQASPSKFPHLHYVEFDCEDELDGVVFDFMEEAGINFDHVTGRWPSSSQTTEPDRMVLD